MDETGGIIVSSEIKQTQKNKYCMFSLICGNGRKVGLKEE
jgi:hypothetical protein